MTARYEWFGCWVLRSLPAKAWEETREAYTARLKKVCDDINSTLDVEGLCRAFPARVDKLVLKEGGRLAE